MHTQEGQEVRSRPRKVWWIVAVSVVVLGLIGVGIWAIVAANQTDDTANQTDDIDVATDLVDEWLAAWHDSDPDAPAALFTEDGVYIDDYGRSMSPDDMGRYMAIHPVAAAERSSELIRTGTGTFTFRFRFGYADYEFEPLIVESWITIQLDRNRLSHMEWTRGQEATGSDGDQEARGSDGVSGVDLFAYSVIGVILVGWLAAIVVCFLKGKPMHGSVGITAVFPMPITALLVWLCVQACVDPGDGCSMTCGVGGLALLLFSVPVSLGVMIFALIGATRLAKPDSWWAEHWYRGRELRAAHERYDAPERATSPTPPT